MGLKLFGGSYSSYDAPPTPEEEKSLQRKNKINQVINLPNPDPNNYKILQALENDGYLIVKIKYMDCTNYEGVKILVYENIKLTDLINQQSIDPHFSENEKYYSPVARFEPTERGWQMARVLVNSIALLTKVTKK